jgi:hypothetical protein
MSTFEYYLIYDGYSESNLRWAVKTQTIRKKLLYTKNMYMLKLLIKAVSVGIEALLSGNKFSYACIKEVQRLWAQTRFDIHQLVITAEARWSQSVLQAGKQVIAARSEISALRRVVKQLLVEMLQQCSGAISCIRMPIVMKEHYTGCQHSTPFVLNSPTQFS